jgi:hypothetical protein
LAGLFAAFFTTGLRPAIFRFAIARSPESNARTVREHARGTPETGPVGSLTEARKFCRLFCLALQR